MLYRFRLSGLPILVLFPLLTVNGQALESNENQAAKTLTVSEAVTLANQSNPSLRKSRSRIQEFEEKVPLVRSTLFPTVDLNVIPTYRKDAASSSIAAFGGDPYNTYQLDLHLSQILFQVGSVSGLQSAKKDREMRKLETEADGRDLTRAVILAYFKIPVAARLLQAFLVEQGIVRESLATAQSRERTGRGQLLDVLQVKTEMALLEAKIANARNELKEAAANLANLLGDPTVEQIQVRDSLEIPKLEEIDRRVDLKHFRLPELEKDRVALEQNEDQKRLRLGTNLPTLSVGADYFYTSYTKSDLLNDNNKSWQVFLTLKIPIFSGLSTIYEQRALAAQRYQLEYDQTFLQNKFALQQVMSRKKLESAQQSILSGEEAVRLGLSSSVEAKRNYRLATIDFVQFLTVQKSYVEAQSTLITNKFDYLTNLTSYFVASGQDLTGLVEMLEKANP